MKNHTPQGNPQGSHGKTAVHTSRTAPKTESGIRIIGQKMCQKFFNKASPQTCPYGPSRTDFHDPNLLPKDHWWHQRSTVNTAKEAICTACNGPEKCCVQANCDRLQALIAYAKYMPTSTTNTISSMYSLPTAPIFSSSLSVQARNNSAAAILRLQKKEAHDGNA